MHMICMRHVFVSGVCDACDKSDTCANVCRLNLCVVGVQGVYDVICVRRWSALVVHVGSRVCVGCMCPVPLVCV